MRRICLLVLAAALLVAGCHSEPETESELREAGKKAFVMQDFAKARDYLGRLVRLRPSDREALYFLGMSYSKDLKYDSALFFLQRVNTLYSDDREANLELYKVGMVTQDAEVAKDAIGALIRTGDPADMYFEDLARLSLKLKQYALATRYFRLLLDREPDNPQRYLDAANSLSGLDSLPVAISLLDSATARFGRRPEFLLNKSLYLTALEKHAESEAILRDLIAEDTANLGYKINLAHVLSSTGNQEKRREAYSLYQNLKGRVDPKFAVDSLMEVLAEKLDSAR